ncbi:hypothetical protein ACWD4L_22030 [Streptomyces sp. NPDC002596]
MAVPEVGEDLFPEGVVVDAVLDELQPLLGFSQDFGPHAHPDPDTGVPIAAGLTAGAVKEPPGFPHVQSSQEGALPPTPFDPGAALVVSQCTRRPD